MKDIGPYDSSTFSLKKIRAADCGAVLLLVMVLLPIFVAIAALLIDIAKAHAAAEQARAMARLLSLSALEQFNDPEVTSKSSGMGDRLQKTLDRVNSLSEQNSLLGTSEGHLTDLKLDDGSDNQEKAGGKLIPGRFFFEKPAESDPCGDNKTPYPCFISLAGKVSDTEVPNSFRVEANFSSGVVTSFGRIFGQQLLPVSASATATIRPRTVIFAIDTTRSVTRETHQLTYPNQQAQSDIDFDEGKDVSMVPRGSQFAFRWFWDNKELMNENEEDKESNKFWSKEPLNDDRQWELLYCNLNQNADPLLCKEQSPKLGVKRKDGDGSPIRHYADDYSLVSLLGSIDYDREKCEPGGICYKMHPEPSPAGCRINDPNSSFCSDPEKYRIDTNSIDTGTGPEPIRTIFEGLRTAVQAFKERQVAGDQVGFIFFDDYLRWSRVLLLNNNWDYMDRISNFEDPDIRNTVIFPLGLFPGSSGFTDILLALQESVRQFSDRRQRIGGAPSLASIVYIGDGLVSCSFAPPQCDPRYDFNDNDMIDFDDVDGLICVITNPTDPECLKHNYVYRDYGRPFTFDDINILNALITSQACNSLRPCGNSFQRYTAGIQNLRGYAQNTLIPSPLQASYSAIIVGSAVAPHTVDHFDGGKNRCLTTQEAIENKKPLAMGGNSKGEPYSDGPSWENAFLNRSASAPFYQAAYDHYLLTAMTGGIYAPIMRGGPGCIKSEDLALDCNDGQRRLADRSCRTPTEQIQDYMRRIISDESPFVVAESN